MFDFDEEEEIETLEEDDSGADPFEDQYIDDEGNDFSADYPEQSFSAAAEFERRKALYMYKGESEDAADSMASTEVANTYGGVHPAPADSDTENPKIQRFLSDLKDFAEDKPAALRFREEIYAQMKVYNLSMKKAYKEVVKKHKAEILEDGYDI